jgi:feruloyl esterase
MTSSEGCRTIKRLLLATTLLSSTAFYISPASAAPNCASLASLTLPYHTTITLAQSYSAGQVVTGTTVAPVALCRVAATAKPGSHSNVKFEVWIPSDGSWNGKYQQVGNGGFAGSIQYAAVANAVSRGYAAASTDDGTSGPPAGAPAFIGNQDVLIDYGHRSLKVTSDNSKAIIVAFMNRGPRRSYFVGCSDGGREALQQAQRYPNDFDGIIVGSPTNDFVGEFGSSYLWNTQALLGGPQTAGVPDAYIPPSLLPVLSNKALAKCVGKDGGAPGDAFLSDPSMCRFDPREVQCKSGDAPGTCLSPAQVAAAKKIYAGAHSSRGELLFPGYEPGGEAAAGDWQSWLTGNSSATGGSQTALGKGFGCNLVEGTATCDYLAENVTQQYNIAKQTIQPIASAINPDLRAFARRGGKMIQYAGWADAAIAPQNGLNYYRAVQKKLGGDVTDFYRVFMVPGMAHCSGGAGVNAFGNGTVNGPVIDADHDLVKALERWVEQGRAPDKIIATHYVNNSASQGVQFQRPLCVYPQRGTYTGGDPNLASSFRCVTHKGGSDPRNLGPQAAYKDNDNDHGNGHDHDHDHGHDHDNDHGHDNGNHHH